MGESGWRGWFGIVRDLLSARDPCRDAPVPMEEVRQAAQHLLDGVMSEREFVEWVHCHVGHEGPQELQELVEIDDDYDPNVFPGSDERFEQDSQPARVRTLALQLVQLAD